MKTLLHIFLVLICTILISALLYIKFPKHLQDPDIEIVTTTSTPTKSPEELLLEKMTPEEKVGQLFIFGFDGTTLTNETQTLITNYHIGGVILFSKNILNEEQTKTLITNIQNTSTIPLFISIDQEGDPVSRLKWDPILTISQSNIDTPEQAYTVAKSRGEILKNTGINMNLAPVVEYITNPSSFIYPRVYRGTQEEVLQKSIASIKGYTETSIISVPKHFPGDSNTSTDSHTTLPTVNISNEQWDTYIQPFSNIFLQTNVDALMVGHIKFTNIDTVPASISYEIITNRLKNNLKYTGLLISDDMGMKALNGIDTYPNIAKRALQAGEDILIYSQSTTEQKKIQIDVYNYILNEVKNGNMNIDDKVLKILQMKTKYNIIH